MTSDSSGLIRFYRFKGKFVDVNLPVKYIVNYKNYYVAANCVASLDDYSRFVFILVRKIY